MIRLLRCAAAGALAWCLVISTIVPEARAQTTDVRLIPSPEPGWPQFRGPRRDGISPERGLLQSWPEGGPKLLWKAENLGRGFSSPVFGGGRLYITGDLDGEVRIFALDLEGRRVWEKANGAEWKNPYPGARSTPAYNSGRIYHQNAHGRLVCLDAENGREIWSANLLEQFGGQNITWGLSECPLVDERAVYATAGGEQALAVAFDKATGKLLWKTPALRDTEGERALENASYTSPILAEFGGRRLLVNCSLRHLFCVDASTGALQWTKRVPTTYSVLAMTPALVNNGIFMTAPHGRGGRLFKLIAPSTRDGNVSVEEVWQTRLDTCQGGVIHVNDRIYGSFYPGRKGWGAVDAKSGEILYEAPDFVKGAPLWAENRLYALSEDGWMRLLEPAKSEFIVRGQFRLADARANDAWAHPVVFDGRMYLRYHESLFVYDVKPASPSGPNS
jgi:outer membrane protein assembly factor BamB